MKKPLILLALAALLLVPAASAHVTVNPNEAEAGSFSRFAVRVPNERPEADTTKVVVELPEGLSFVSFQPKPGWKRTVTMVKLAKPVTDDDGETQTERIGTVTWEGGAIAPGEFDEFGLSARVPDKAGAIVFPATQTYSNGETVRWIGEPDSDTPAPRVTLAAPAASEESSAGTSTVAAPAESEDGDDRDNVTFGLAVAALALAVVAIGLNRGPRRG